jgi:hypothetical protein
MARIGVDEARAEDLGQARALAAALIDPAIAPEEAIRAIHARSGCGIYLVHEGGEVAGIVAMVLLNRAGLAAVKDNTFNPLTPALEHVAEAHEEPAAVYGWGVAGATREAASVVVQGSRVALETIRQPYFARAATEAGHRMLTAKLGFIPHPGSTTGLLWREPHGPARRAA